MKWSSGNLQAYTGRSELLQNLYCKDKLSPLVKIYFQEEYSKDVVIVFPESWQQT